MNRIVTGLVVILAGLGYVALCHFYPSPQAWWWLDFNQARWVMFALFIAGWLVLRTGLRRGRRR